MGLTPVDSVMTVGSTLAAEEPITLARQPAKGSTTTTLLTTPPVDDRRDRCILVDATQFLVPVGSL